MFQRPPSPLKGPLLKSERRALLVSEPSGERMTDLFHGLNPEQLKAVKHIDGTLLVLAGAGSGKTRVLTHRIANMLTEGIRPWNILAVTFTNKAAKEMRERVRALVGPDADKVWISTFHAACLRILRRDIEPLGYKSTFNVYDTSDQKTLLRNIIKELRFIGTHRRKR